MFHQRHCLQSSGWTVHQRVTGNIYTVSPRTYHTTSQTSSPESHAEHTDFTMLVTNTKLEQDTTQIIFFLYPLNKSHAILFLQPFFPSELCENCDLSSVTNTVTKEETASFHISLLSINTEQKPSQGNYQLKRIPTPYKNKCY